MRTLLQSFRQLTSASGEFCSTTGKPARFVPGTHQGPDVSYYCAVASAIIALGAQCSVGATVEKPSSAFNNGCCWLVI